MTQIIVDTHYVLSERRPRVPKTLRPRGTISPRTGILPNLQSRDKMILREEKVCYRKSGK